MKLLRRLRRLRDIYRIRPYILVSLYGQATPSPRINVGVHSRRGMQGVYDYPDDDSGNARADLHSRGLARVTGLPILDTRATQRWEEQHSC